MGLPCARRRRTPACRPQAVPAGLAANATAAAIAGAVMLAAGCASYSPEPLDGDIAAVLASPDRSALMQQAAALRHSRLRPVTLDFSRALSLDEIAVIAVLANPELRVSRAGQHLADAQVFAAGLVPDPQLGIGFDKVLSPLNQGLATAYTGGLTLDLLGALATRHAEVQAARGAAEQVRLDIAWQEWLTAGNAELLALRLASQQTAAQLARVAADAAETALNRALAAAARGDLGAGEVEARRIAASDATERALTAERDAERTRLDLNHLLGLAPGEQLAIAPVPPPAAWTAPDPEALFEQARDARLDLRALASGYASREAALHRAVLGQFPRFSLTLNRARDTSRVHTFGPAVTFDLPLWNRNRGAIAIATADREHLRLEYAARLQQTRAEIAALVAALNRDEAARSGLAARLPQIEQLADRMEQAAARGDLTATAAESARATAIDKRLALLQLEQACAEQRLALALAVGRALPSITDEPTP